MENKEAKVGTLRHYLPSGAKPFDFNFQKIGAVKFDGFNGSTESSFLNTYEGFLDFSAEVLVKKIILHLGTQNGKRLNDTEIEVITAPELEAFSKVLLENNRHLWNDYQPSGDSQTAGKQKPFMAVPFERVDGESNTHYLKRMFDDYNRVNLEIIRNAQDKFKSILKKDSETFKAIQENVINSMQLNAQISINENEKWLHHDYGLLSITPSPSEKTNDILNDLTGTMQKMHQLSLSHNAFRKPHQPSDQKFENSLFQSVFAIRGPLPIPYPVPPRIDGKGFPKGIEARFDFPRRQV